MILIFSDNFNDNNLDLTKWTKMEFPSGPEIFERNEKLEYYAELTTGAVALRAKKDEVYNFLDYTKDFIITYKLAFNCDNVNMMVPFSFEQGIGPFPFILKKKTVDGIPYIFKVWFGEGFVFEDIQLFEYTGEFEVKLELKTVDNKFYGYYKLQGGDWVQAYDHNNNMDRNCEVIFVALDDITMQQPQEPKFYQVFIDDVNIYQGEEVGPQKIFFATLNENDKKLKLTQLPSHDNTHHTLYFIDQNQVFQIPTPNMIPRADMNGKLNDWVDGGGVSDHSLLTNLDYSVANHTGFSPDIHTHAGSKLECYDLVMTNGAMNGKYLMCLNNEGSTIWTVPNWTNIHGSLTGLSYASAGHTGFQPSGNYALSGNYITSISGEDHSVLTNLDFASAGHTGFQPSGNYLISISGEDHSILTNLDYASAGHTGFAPTIHNHSGMAIAPSAIYTSGIWATFLNLPSAYSITEDDIRINTGSGEIGNPYFLNCHTFDGIIFAGLFRNNEDTISTDLATIVSTDSGDTLGFVIANSEEENPRIAIEKTEGIIFTDGTNYKLSMVPSGDIQIFDSTQGLILTDRTTGSPYRLYIDNGSLLSEEVI